LQALCLTRNAKFDKDGERKGFTSIEILTGKQQEKDWVELLNEDTGGIKIASCILLVYICFIIEAFREL